MKERTLRSLYYEDKDVYNKEYENRFNDSDTVKLDFLVEDNQAFFTQNEEVAKLMYSILRLDKEIVLLRFGLPQAALEQYSKKCLIDEIVITNNIEGVHSSRREIDDALEVLEEQSAKRGKEMRFLGMVNKYYKLLRRDPVQLAGCQDLRDIYDELVLKEVVEEDPENAPDGAMFRKGPASVYSVTGKIVHNGTTPEARIIEQLENALAFLNDTSIEALYRICLFHYMLEYVHPFYDGNGRLGRFILSYCISNNLTDILAYRISETIKENINKYYDAFTICNDPHNRGELTPFLTMMLGMIEKAALELRDTLKRKTISWGRYEETAERIAENAQIKKLYSVLIQATLFSEEGVPMKGLEAFMKLGQITIRKKLAAIKERGLLMENRKGNTKYYKISLNAMDTLWMNTD